MQITKLALTPITFWDSSGKATSRDRIFMVGLDQVTSITHDETRGVYIVELEDREDEDDEGNPVIESFRIEVFEHQVRLVHLEETNPAT